MIENEEIIDLFKKFLEQSTQSGWYANNQNWFVPMIMTAIISIISMLLIMRNTNKRAEEQNRLAYRPFLYFDIVDEKFDMNNLLLINGEELSKTMLDAVLKVRNTGNGLASNIKFFETARNKFISPGVKSTNRTLFISIEKDGIITFNLLVDYGEVEHGKITEVICLCSDIAGNIHKYLIEIFKVKGGELPHPDPKERRKINDHIAINVVPDTIAEYKNKVIELNIKEKEVVELY